MSTWVVLMNLTDEGAKTMDTAPEDIEKSKQGLEEAGCKLVALYMVMGEYDYVAIVETPSDEVALAQLLVVGMQGQLRTTTMRAFTVEEITKIVGMLPAP
jgi:uncharacterized protein with GYD domain